MKRTNILILILVLLNIGLGAGVLLGYTPSTKQTHAPEIKTILESDAIPVQTKAYRDLLERVGLEQGQTMLYTSGLPFTGQTHLINHTAGDYAYEKYGTEGIAHCKNYFLGSCYHSAIINTIANEGIAALDETMRECRAAGGASLAAQCAHGIGHGLLAWFGYKKLPKALGACDAFDSRNEQFPLFNCHDGVFMENLWGMHEGGSPSPERWIKENDLTYPCSDSRIRSRWQRGCWSNQPAAIYQITEGDLSAAADVCNKRKTQILKEICFDGLSRQIHPIADGEVQKTLDMCRSIMPSGWKNECVISIIRADISSGGRDMAYALCAQIDNAAQDRCYRVLINLAQVYLKNPSTACDKIEHADRARQCHIQLSDQ